MMADIAAETCRC